jgi:hypothetical protein
MNLTALGVIFLQPPKRKSEAESTDGETRKDEVAAAS